MRLPGVIVCCIVFVKLSNYLSLKLYVTVISLFLVWISTLQNLILEGVHALPRACTDGSHHHWSP
jgi:hypothetical protein